MRGIYLGNTGMVTEQLRQESLAQNLAHVGTPGYKREVVVLEPFPEVLLQRLGAVPRERPLRTPVGFTNWGVAAGATATDYAPGPLKETGRELDFACAGEGFFTVETPAGIRYTRDGSFFWNAEGNLVTSRGDYVLGRTGRLVKTEDAPPGPFLITNFAAPQYLEREADNLFSAPPAAGAEEVTAPQVLQGYLEQANLDLAAEMTNFLAAFRAYEASQRLLQAEDGLLAKAGELGRLE